TATCSRCGTGARAYRSPGPRRRWQRRRAKNSGSCPVREWRLSMGRSAVCPLACLLLLTTTARADEGTSLDKFVTDAMRVWRVPGVAVAVVREDRVIYLKGLGVRDTVSGQPVTPDTIFPLASCTKSFTTSALALLVDEGKLSWDDHVRKHVSFFH